MKGFTLIEIIIGLAIISLLFLVGYAAYQEFARRQALNTAYDKAKSSLELAQQLALSGEKPSGCGTNVLSKYKVDLSGASYTIKAVCGSEITMKPATSYSFGITVTTPLLVEYMVLGKGTNLGSDQNFTFSQSSTGKTLEATITKEGILKRR